MAFQLRKIILFFLIFSFSFGDCCCAGYINSTANAIKNYIKNQNLDIATKYIKKHKDNLNSIISSVKEFAGATDFEDDFTVMVIKRV